MNLILILIGILIVARVGGELFQRLKQPAILGELLAGACLGLFITYVPNLPEQLSGLKHNDIFLTLGDLGILFLMFLAGMQIKPRQFVNASRSGMAVAIGGVIVPLALGYGFGRMVLPDSDYVFSQSLFLGIALSITAIPVSVRVLMDLNLLNTPVGRVLVNAAAADDVIGLVLLAVLTATLGHDGSGGGTDIVLTFLKVAGFLVFTILAGRFAMPWLAEKLRHMKSTEAEFTIALVFALLISTAAEFAGLHYAIGAFIAGLFVNQISSNRQVFRNLENTTSAIALGFLAPFFFVSLGLSIDFSAIGASPLLIVGVVLIAIIGKLLGAAAGARLARFSWRNSLGIGWGMNGRGAVELIVANIAMEHGLFTHPQPVPPVVANLYSSILIMAFVTSLLVPVGLATILHNKH